MTEHIVYKDIKRILFVCMGNICRSPTAEAVFRDKATQNKLTVSLDSAGTIGSHAREKPDHRAQKAGNSRGYKFDNIRARKVTVEDFADFDIILAMDEQNLRDLKKLAPAGYHDKIHLFLQYAENFEDMEVPDPYYGGARGFKYVLDLVEDASDGLIKKMKAKS
ncbi:low molecular weight protein-tyrosine-phosphatase [Thalassotalea sediminis]|uniref:low molecular weight protein-tyrosine-phosphatase n=1 Tax=Thalassotalea sediminis TaxID=1759089 RepID=UPI0025736105|nr:low molecular weight protein-tyrosine-phosphatase [Thalassotalea sediminis]